MQPVSNGARHPFLLACRLKPSPFTPVWLMRQAGRYLPEYRRLRERFSFIELCKRSDVAAEVTVNAARRLGVDAAIVFADILLPLIAMRVNFRFTPTDGPLIEAPIRTAEHVAAIATDNVEELSFVAETIRLARRDLSGVVPLIGFAGAPFTLASYLIEGGPSRDYVATKRFMYEQPAAWDALMDAVATTTNAYLGMQIDAGADALQLFDSWVGCLSPEDYERYALPAAQRVIEVARARVPVIYFGTMTAGLLERVRDCGANVVGVDWRVPLERAWDRLGSGVAIQGNLDPALLLSNPSRIRSAARSILQSVNGRPGHVFNLGHGVLPQTPVDNVLALVDAVHEFAAS